VLRMYILGLRVVSCDTYGSLKVIYGKAFGLVGLVCHYKRICLECVWFGRTSRVL